MIWESHFFVFRKRRRYNVSTTPGLFIMRHGAFMPLYAFWILGLTRLGNLATCIYCFISRADISLMYCSFSSIAREIKFQIAIIGKLNCFIVLSLWDRFAYAFTKFRFVLSLPYRCWYWDRKTHMITAELSSQAYMCFCGWNVMILTSATI